MNDCTGYACPPEHSIPAHDVIVNVTSHLATTGTDPNMLVGGIITAALLILGSGILFAYNHLKHRDGA